MGKLISITLIITFSFITAGCSSVLGYKLLDEDHYLNPPKYDDEKSYAYNVMVAADLPQGIYDHPKPENFDDVGANNRLAGTLIEAGLLSAAWGGLGALGQGVSVLTFGGGPSPADYIRGFGWIPKELASNKQDAEILLNNLLLAEVNKYYLKREYTSVKSPKKLEKNIAIFEGNGCEKFNNNLSSACRLWMPSYVATDGVNRSPTKELIDAVSPQYMGSNDSYFTYSRTIYGYIGGFYEIFPNPPKAISLTERYVELSKGLPKWVYIYLPQRTSRKNPEDYPNVPVLVNQGKIHYFFTPESK